jgi:hypothetical protein
VYLPVNSSYNCGLLKKLPTSSTVNTRVMLSTLPVLLRQQRADYSTRPHGSCRLLYAPEEAVAKRIKGQKEALGASGGSCEDAHRYANRNSAPLFSFLRTVLMNLLRNGGYRSAHAGQQELSHDIRGMLALGGVTMSTT